MSTTVPKAPTGAVPAIGVPDSQDYPRLVYTAPYFAQTPLAELIEPSVIEAAEAVLPVLVPPYVQGAADAAVDQRAVLLTGSTMSGPLYLNPAIPTQPSQAASMAYVELMVSAGPVPEVPPVPFGQTWARQTGAWVATLSMAGGTLTGALTVPRLNISNIPLANPDGSPPAGAVHGDLYNNGGFVCVTP